MGTARIGDSAVILAAVGSADEKLLKDLSNYRAEVSAPAASPEINLPRGRRKAAERSQIERAAGIMRRFAEAARRALPGELSR